MYELIESELSVVTGGMGTFDGSEFFGGMGACGTCGLGVSAPSVSSGPFISSFTNENARTFAFKTALATSNVNHNSIFTLIN